MPQLPDFEAWAIFAKVAATGTFSGAAVELNLSKATVSKAIGRLELRLGTPLLHRTSRRLSLTESGRSALERASRILAEGEAIEEEVSEKASVPRGMVRLAAPMSFGVMHLGAVLPEFLGMYPEVTIDLRLSDARTDLVADGIDVALRIGVLADSSLKARRLFAVRVPFVASRSYIEAHGMPEHPRDLERHHVIGHSHMGSPNLMHFAHLLEGDQIVRVVPRLIVNNADVMVPALLDGIGIGGLPEFIVWDHLRSGRLVEVLPAWGSDGAALHLVTPPGALRPPRVSVLMEFLGKRFLKAPWAHALG